MRLECLLEEIDDEQRYWIAPDGKIIPSDDYHHVTASTLPDVERGLSVFAANQSAWKKGYLDIIIQNRVLWIRRVWDEISSVQQKSLQKMARMTGFPIKYDKQKEHG